MSLQTEFTRGIFDPASPVPDGITDPKGQDCPKRFSVYRNNVVHSLINALCDAYPAVQKDVGEAFFEAMAGFYVRQHPPQSPLMMFYGAQFSDFLQGFKPVSERKYLVDLARLEALMRDAYHARDDAVLSPTKLGELDGADLMSVRFSFRASSKLVHSAYPVLSIWLYQLQGTPIPAQAGAENILLTRPDLDVQMTRLTAADFAFLSHLEGGATMGEAFDRVASTQPDFDLGAALGLAFQSSCFSNFILGDKNETDHEPC